MLAQKKKSPVDIESGEAGHANGNGQHANGNGNHARASRDTADSVGRRNIFSSRLSIHSLHSSSLNISDRVQRAIHGAGAFLRARGISRRYYTVITGLVLLTAWTFVSTLFAYTYNYWPPVAFRIPEDVSKPPPACVEVNKTCLFAVGGGITLESTFLPVTEGYNGTQWGSHALLPKGVRGYGRGTGTGLVSLGNSLYALGHSEYGDFYQFSRSTGSGEYEWTKLSSLNFRRNGVAYATFNGRIYAIGGKTLCLQEDPEENPNTRCAKAGWILDGNNPGADRTTIMESIDPSTETAWTVECYNGGADAGGLGVARKCLKTERSGASAAIYKDKLFVIGGFHGTEVEVFDGDKFTPLEVDFPVVVFGAASVFWKGKLWVTGGFSYNTFYTGAITFDGKIWSKETDLSVARAWHAAAVFRDRMFVVGGANATDAIADVESYSLLGGWKKEQNLPNARSWLGAAAFSMP